MKTTNRQQKYLETIDELTVRHGHAHTKDIAEKLDVEMASVTEAVKNLATRGYLNYKSRKYAVLTEKGQKIADELSEKHAVLADFFKDILDCPEKRADEFACSIEHIVDDKFCNRILRLAAFLKSHECIEGESILETFIKSNINE